MQNTIIQHRPLTPQELLDITSMPEGCIYLGQGPHRYLLSEEGHRATQGTDEADPGLYRKASSEHWHDHSSTRNVLHSSTFRYAIDPAKSWIWTHLDEAVNNILNPPGAPTTHEF